MGQRNSKKESESKEQLQKGIRSEKRSKTKKSDSKHSISQKNKLGNSTKHSDKLNSLRKRVQISSHEMYLEYKLEYQSKYEEYTSLISEISTTQKQFADLGEAWKKAPSTDQENINKQITTLYQQNFQKTQDMKARYRQLHNELKEIKQLIKEGKKFDLDCVQNQS